VSTEKKDLSRRILAYHLLITHLSVIFFVTRVGEDEEVGTVFSKPSAIVEPHNGVRPALYKLSKYL